MGGQAESIQGLGQSDIWAQYSDNQASYVGRDGGAPAPAHQPPYAADQCAPCRSTAGRAQVSPSVGNAGAKAMAQGLASPKTRKASTANCAGVSGRPQRMVSDERVAAAIRFARSAEYDSTHDELLMTFAARNLGELRPDQAIALADNCWYDNDHDAILKHYVGRMNLDQVRPDQAIALARDCEYDGDHDAILEQYVESEGYRLSQFEVMRLASQAEYDSTHDQILKLWTLGGGRR